MSRTRASRLRLSLVLLILSLVLALPTRAKAADLPAGTYVIQSALKSSMVLDKSGTSKKAGVNVALWTNNNGANQQWVIGYDSSGRATLINVQSGMALNVVGGKGVKGANLAQDTPNGSAAQKWTIKKNSDGTYTMVSALGSNLVADVSRSGTKNGTNVLLWTNSGAKNQKWRFVRVGSATPTPTPAPTTDSEGEQADIADGCYILSPKVAPSSALDVYGCSTVNGGNLIIWASSGSANQRFYINKLSDGTYRITNAYSGRAVCIANGSTKPGANACQWEIGDAANQKWAIFSHGGGEYTLRNVGTGLMLDVTGGKSKNGTNVEGWTANGKNPQRWKITKATDPWQDGANLAAQNKDVVYAGSYLIGSTVNLDVVLDVKGASKSSGANVALWTYGYAANQIWTIRYDKNGFATILNDNSGMALTYGATSNGSNVSQATLTEAPNQKWVIVENADGTYSIMAAVDTRYCIDVTRNKHVAGTNIELYKSNGGAGQKFRIASVVPKAEKVTSVAFEPQSPIELREGVDYAWGDKGYELQRGFLRDGDELSIGTNRFPRTYVLKNEYGDPVFVNKDNPKDRLQPWSFGADDATGVDFAVDPDSSTLKVSYMDKSCTVGVTVLADPIKDLTYSRPGGAVLVRGTDSNMRDAYVGGKWVSWNCYYTFMEPGDELAITYRDGVTKTYVYQQAVGENLPPMLFVNKQDASYTLDLDLWFASDQDYGNEWDYGTHSFTFELYGRTWEFEVECVPAQ